MIEQLIVTQLNNDAGLTALVGSRIYPYRLPADTSMPAITYRLLESPEDQALESGTGLYRSLYRFYCYGSTYLSSVAVDNALSAALTNWTISSGGVTVQSTRIRNKIDYDDPEIKVLIRIVDFVMWHYGR